MEFIGYFLNIWIIFPHYSDLAGLEDEDAEAALEEKEALKLQRQMAEQLDDADFGLDMFTDNKDGRKEQAEAKEERIVKDLSQMSRKDKLKVNWGMSDCQR